MAATPDAWCDENLVYFRVPAHWPLAKAGKLNTLGWATPVGDIRQFEHDAAPAVARYAQTEGLHVSRPLLALAKEVNNRADVHFHNHVIHVERRAHTPDLSKTIPRAMPRKAKTRRYFVVPAADSPTVIEWARTHGISVSPDVIHDAETRWEKEIRAYELSMAATADEPVNITGLTTPLLDTQKPPIIAAIESRRLLIADDPGMGKTLSALAIARATQINSRRAVIVCPSSLTENWAVETRAHFDHDVFTPWIATGETPEPVPDNVDLVVIGWAILHAWVDELKRWKPDFLAVDEGHYAKAGKQQQRKVTNPKRDNENNLVRDAKGNVEMVEETKLLGGSARATAAMNLARAIPDNGVVLALTGTPVVNRPKEMMALLEILGVLHIFGGAQTFQLRHCGAKKNFIGAGRGIGGSGYVWDYSGASHLLEMNTRLRCSGHYLRRTKEVLVNSGLLQKKFVDTAYVYDRDARRTPWLVDGAPDVMAEYRAAEEDASAFFAERARELAEQLKAKPDSVKVKAKVAVEGGGKHLARIAALRVLSARAKVPTIIELASSLAAKGEKLVIAAHHREVVDAYAEAFSGLKIQGGMSTAETETAKALFNETPATEHPVLVLSIEAGKTGHTLCKQEIHGAGPACAHLVFAEQPWTPGDESQTQDRIWRVGQPREVRIANPLVRDTLDVSIYERRMQKRRIVDAVVDAIDAAELDEKTAGVGALAVELAESHQPQPDS